MTCRMSYGTSLSTQSTAVRPTHWTKWQVVVLLNELLRSERAGARALASMISDAHDTSVQSLLMGLEMTQASFTVALWQEIEALGGCPSSETGPLYARCQRLSDLRGKVELVECENDRLARKIAKALSKIADRRLHSKLRIMQESHQHEIERLTMLLRQQATRRSSVDGDHCEAKQS
jgi:hypothetical protein